MKNLFDIQGQVVVITGGTGVLGREIGEYLALQGAKVVLMGRTMLNSCSFRQISLRMGRVRSGISKNSFHFTTDTFLPFVEYGGKNFSLSLYNGHF